MTLSQAGPQAPEPAANDTGSRERLLHTFVPRGALLLSALTFLGYLMGLLRDRTFARTFGAGPELDAYNAALVLPELMVDVLVIAGLTAAFVPVFTTIRQQDSDAADAFGSTVLKASIALMAVVVVLLFVFAPQTVDFGVAGALRLPPHSKSALVCEIYGFIAVEASLPLPERRSAVFETSDHC